jgi:cell division protein FtsB
MFNWYDIRKQTRNFAAPLACVCAITYFAYHTVQGHRSLITYVHLDGKIVQAQTDLAALDTERAQLERRVALLRPENLDRDI